ncbi:hypothetical protein [Kribbella flavida]|uniref:hypothetical protein n=1 Tax=Kribbella flavida TaxID=182640 RepID=UPI0011D1FBA8|nr:hypothetical protein [Kribbella flavida]
MSVWRCRVCEGVNQGGRTCTICGAEVPPGEVLRTAVRRRVPSAHPPVPATPRRRELRDLPAPDELRPLEPGDLFGSLEDVEIRPLPGGCLVSVVPRPRRR